LNLFLPARKRIAIFGALDVTCLAAQLILLTIPGRPDWAAMS